MKRALERHAAGEALVIPVILRPVDWQATEFGKLQALPRDGKAGHDVRESGHRFRASYSRRPQSDRNARRCPPTGFSRAPPRTRRTRRRQAQLSAESLGSIAKLLTVYIGPIAIDHRSSSRRALQWGTGTFRSRRGRNCQPGAPLPFFIRGSQDRSFDPSLVLPLGRKPAPPSRLPAQQTDGFLQADVHAIQRSRQAGNLVLAFDRNLRHSHFPRAGTVGEGAEQGNPAEHEDVQRPIEHRQCKQEDQRRRDGKSQKGLPRSDHGTVIGTDTTRAATTWPSFQPKPFLGPYCLTIALGATDGTLWHSMTTLIRAKGPRYIKRSSHRSLALAYDSLLGLVIPEYVMMSASQSTARSTGLVGLRDVSR